MEHYVNLYALLYKVTLDIVEDRDLIDDLIHDAMIRLIDKLDFLKSKEPAVQVSYIVRTVSNTAKNYVASKNRRRKHEYSGVLDDLSDILPDPSDSAEENIYVACDYEDLGRAMEHLPERDRELLYFKYVAEMDDAEIAHQLDINVKNIRAYFSRAKKRARKLMREEELHNAKGPKKSTV